MRNDQVEIDMVATHLQADHDCEADLPYIVREYLRGMIDPPRIALVMESVLVAGVAATLAALRERDMNAALSGSIH